MLLYLTGEQVTLASSMSDKHQKNFPGDSDFLSEDYNRLFILPIYVIRDDLSSIRGFIACG